MGVIWALWVPMVVFSHCFALFWLLKTWALNKAQQLAKSREKQKPKASTEEKNSPAKSSKNLAASRKSNDTGGPAGTDQATGTDIESPFAGGGATSFDRDSFKSVDSADGDDIPDLSATACATLRRSLSLETETLAMEWQDMGCAYNINGKRKEVLKGIYGEARPGEMHALMGPSGAGKSTFMDCLAMRKSVGELTGQLMLNGQPATKAFIRKTAYVPQDDNFVPTMTSWETLSFYANVILPQKKFNPAARKARVTEVLAALGLGHAHKTLVGGTLPGGLMLRGLSGGERKRLAVGAGILAAPAVLFLDEPTSGLDSFAALSVMGYLQKMGRATGQIVITTIHQPRSAIWQMFDAVTLLANGRLMYTGNTDDMIDWFGSQGYVYDSSLHGVPSDWALDLVAVGFSKPAKYYGHTMRTEQDLRGASEAFTTRYLAGHAAAKTEAGLKRSPTLAATVQKKANYPTGWFKQYSSLLSREFLSITRNPFDVAGRTITFCWVGILEGLLFFNLPNDGSSLRTRLNVLFCILSFVILMPYISMGLYTADKKFYLADASAKLYRPSAYYLAKVTATLPFQIICALVFDWTVYGMAGLRFVPAIIFQHAVLVVILYLIAVQVLHLCAMLAPNQDTAFMLSLVWTTLQMLLANFFISFAEVFMVWLRYFRYLSALYFALEGATLLEFKNIEYSCAAGLGKQYLSLIFDALPTLSDVQKKTIQREITMPRPGCVVRANAIIDYYDYNRLFGFSVGVLLIYWIGLHVLTFVVMRVAARKENR